MRVIDVPVIVLTSDQYLWALRGFSLLFNRYWGEHQPVQVFGFRAPDFELPSNFSFRSIAPINYPKRRWSEGLFRALSILGSRYALLMLEDYWLRAPVDIDVIDASYVAIETRSDILRVDLSADRVSKAHQNYAAGRRSDSSKFKIIRSSNKAPYLMSFQAAIWDVSLLQQALRPEESPWEAEVNGSKRLYAKPSPLILGTDAHPLKYTPVLRHHRPGINLKGFDRDVVMALEQAGALEEWIPV
jgi:hypothetical protein